MPRGSSCAAVGLVLAAALVLASCADSTLVSAAPSAAAAVPVSIGITQIEQLIGSAACSNDGECRVIGVGALACGGPEAYRPWSITQTDARTLEIAVARHAAIRRAEIERAGMLSTCAIEPVPGVACIRAAERAGAGRCVLMPAGGAGR